MTAMQRHAREKLANDFLFLVRCAGLPAPVREYQFHATRKWLFDFAFIEQRIAVEVDGGNWINGGHNTGTGRDRDNEKQNAAVLGGWRVLRFTASMLRRKTETIDIITEALK